MKRFGLISLTMLLSLTILLMEPGFNIVRCNHTGRVKVMTSLRGMRTQGGAMKCGKTSGCMTVEHVQLSPTVAAQNFVYDFSAAQPLIAFLPTLVSSWLTPVRTKTVVQPVPIVRKIPPRDYLNLIQVLLI